MEDSPTSSCHMLQLYSVILRGGLMMTTAQASFEAICSRAIHRADDR